MSIFSYIMPRDYGFAPNPFWGYCTLATCKPGIRSSANNGDWIVGLGSNAQGSKYKNKIIYIMQVQEKMTFDKYWNDKRFACKRANVNGSRAYQYGDNVYHKVNGVFVQEDCHHSHSNNIQNDKNYYTDTRVDAVLVSQNYLYWGALAIEIPSEIQYVTYKWRNYKRNNISDEEIQLDNWVKCYKDKGRIGEPDHFEEKFSRYPGA